MTVDIKRLNFYEGQFIRATDMRDWQAYLIDARRRHYVGHHTWGIVTGMEITQDPASKVWSVAPGMLVDGWGREIIVTDPEPLDVARIASLLQGISGAAPLQIWIAYASEPTDRPPPGYASCVTPIPFTRMRETFTLIYAPLLNPAESTPPTPFQDLGDDPAKTSWPIFLGLITWDTDPSNPPAKTITASSPTDALNGVDRPFVGIVAETVFAPGDLLTLRPASLTAADTPETGDFAAVLGALRVGGRLTANDRFRLRGRMSFENPGQLPTDPNLWLQRNGNELRLSIGDTPMSPSSFSIGTEGTPATNLLTVTADSNVKFPDGEITISKGELSFGQTFRQKLNLWRTDFGIGVQTNALYFRSGKSFYWYVGGGESPSEGDSGGGITQLQLDESGNLFVRGDVFVGPTKVKIPGQKTDIIDVVIGEQSFSGSTGLGLDHNGTLTIDVQTTRLANPTTAAMFLSMTDISNTSVATDAKWKVVVNGAVQKNTNTWTFSIDYFIGDSDGFLTRLAYLVVFYA